MKKFFLAFMLLANLAVAQVVNPSFVGPGGRPPTFTANGVLLGQGGANVTATTAGTSGQCLLSSGPGVNPNWGSCAAGGAGTVTLVSVAPANGLSGSVATATTTPVITLSTTVTGIHKGVGSAITTATAGTDYSVGTSANATGIVKSTTGTGALTTAVAADFPTLNQSTTGNAATATTATAVSGIVPIANGGTGLSATPTNGQIDIGNGTNFTRTAITGGSGITVTNGAGSITIAASGSAGGLVLLQTITPTATTSVNALTSFSATYDNYMVILDGIIPAVDDSLILRFGNAGVAVTSANYFTGSLTGGNYGVSGSTSFNLTSSQTAAAGVGATYKLEFENVNSTTSMKSGVLRGSYQSASNFVSYASSYYYPITNAISGFQLTWVSGSSFTAVGKIRIYGYNN